jgi:iron(III) transport system ATP-binding protein
VTKRYHDVLALDDVSLEVPDGDRLAIEGPSGSGKSTLLRLIAGLDLPDTGEVYLADRLASRSGWGLEPHRREVGFVFQSAALWPHMTVRQNVLFGLKRWPRPEAERRVEALLGQMWLGHLGRRYPDEVSGGEARRVALARTLAPRPRHLLLDEPLASLDPELKNELLALILSYARDRGGTLLYVTHDRAEALAVAPRVLRLRAGRVVDLAGDPSAPVERSR